MADIKWISVQSAGNPNGSDGVAPITMFNNPQFEVNNDTHGGLGGNEYYFSVVIENNFTVYKIIKNNVRSNQSIRGGYLAIAFSIPRGFELINSTPYLVLMDLWKSFRDRCMTLKDKVAGTYEYNSTSVDKTVLDEIAKTYSLRSSNRPYRPMNSKGAKALVVVPVDKMKELLADVHYEEFSNYSEILIAETASPEANFERINNLKIPKPKSYALYVDGEYQGAYTDVEEIISPKIDKVSECFDYKPVTFTIQNLREGYVIPGVEFLEREEKINVSTEEWEEIPKIKKITLRFSIPEAHNYFREHKNLLELTCQKRQIQLDQELSYTLKGSEISFRHQVNLEIDPKAKYRRSRRPEYKDNESKLYVYVEKIEPIYQTQSRQNNYRYSPSGNATGSQPVRESPVVDVTLQIENFEKLNSDKTMVPITLRKEDGEGGSMVRCWQAVDFKKPSPSSNYYEGHFYVPKEGNQYSRLHFNTRKQKWVSLHHVDLNTNNITLKNINFDVTNKSAWNKRTFFLIISTVATLLLGFVLGDQLHDKIKSWSKSPQIENSQDTINVSQESTFTRDSAFIFLKDVDNRLRAKDLKFDEIDDFYEKLIKNEKILQECDNRNFENKICKRIQDYKMISDYIRRGDFASMQQAMSYGNRALHIWSQHTEIVRNILSDESLFMNKYSSFSSFLDISEVYIAATAYPCPCCDLKFDSQDNLDDHIRVSHPTHIVINNMFTCDKCNKSFSSESELQTHKKTHAVQGHFVCQRCGPDVWFKTKKELENHTKNIHTERL